MTSRCEKSSLGAFVPNTDRLFESDQPQISREENMNHRCHCPLHTQAWRSGLWARMSGNEATDLKADRLCLIFLCTLLDCCSNVVCKVNLGERSARVESFYDALHLSFAFCIGFLWLTTNYRLEVRLGAVGRRWVKSKVQGRLCSFLESLAEHLFPGLFQLLEAACIP